MFYLWIGVTPLPQLSADKPGKRESQKEEGDAAPRSTACLPPQHTARGSPGAAQATVRPQVSWNAGLSVLEWLRVFTVQEAVAQGLPDELKLFSRELFPSIIFPCQCPEGHRIRFHLVEEKYAKKQWKK